MHLPLVKPIFRIAALIFSSIVYLLTIAAAYGGRFDTDFFTWPAILTLALPYLAIATVVITIAWFCFGKIFGGALGILTLLISWGPVTTAVPIGRSHKPSEGTKVFSLMSYNMIHGRDQEKKDSTANRTIQYIIDSDADIVCLQELVDINFGDVPNMSSRQRERIEAIYPYREGSKSNDTKILSKYPVERLDASKYVTEGYDVKRYSFFRVTIDGTPVTIVNLHLRSFFMTAEDCDSVTRLGSVNEMKQSFEMLKGPLHQKMRAGFRKRKADASALRKALDRMDGPLIVCGDFNDVPASYAYRLLKGSDLRDAYVETGLGPMITYNMHGFWFHLDQIFYRGPLRALDVRRGDVKCSDHYPLMAEFELTKPE